MNTIEKFNIICTYTTRVFDKSWAIYINGVTIEIESNPYGPTKYLCIEIDNDGNLGSNYGDIIEDLDDVDTLIKITFGVKNLIPINIAYKSNLLNVWK